MVGPNPSMTVVLIFFKKKEFGHRNKCAQREKDVKTYREKTVI